jgi:hypothetical protein
LGWSSAVGLFDDKRKYFDKHCVMIRYVENRTRPLPSNLLLNLSNPFPPATPQRGSGKGERESLNCRLCMGHITMGDKKSDVFKKKIRQG